ncbi:MAG: hypothetical protein ACREEC_15065 [Thermoplasmata archaeon]
MPSHELPVEPPVTNSLPFVRIGVFVVALIIIVAAVVSTASMHLSSAPGLPGGLEPDTVNVSAVRVSAPPTACGLSGITPGAFSVPGGTVYPFEWSLPISGPVPCSVASVSTNVSGFGIVRSNLPIDVTLSNQGAFLQLQLSTPGAFNGVLYLNFA